MRVLILCEGKTGSTALLEGIATALSIENKAMEPGDLSAVLFDGQVVVKKLIENTVDTEMSLLTHFDRRIFLIRDPRDSLISRLLYMPYKQVGFDDDNVLSSYLELIRDKIDNPNAISLRAIITSFNGIVGTDILRIVRRLNKRSIELFNRVSSQFFLFRYEDFVSENRGALENYIGANIPSDIKVEKNFARVERSKAAGEWRHWMTAEDCK